MLTVKTTSTDRLNKTTVDLRRTGLSSLLLAMLIAGCGDSRADNARVEVDPVMIDAGNRFGFNVYQQLAMENPDNNVFFSPYSISSAFMMAAGGAVGETEEEMKQVLCLPGTVTESQQALAALSRHLENVSRAENTELRIANAIWGEKTYPFHPEYVAQLNRHFDTGGLFSVDFRTNAEPVRKRINGWVEDQTNNRIRDLLPAGSINQTTRLVLVNAVYFKANWAVPFDKRFTKDGQFFLTGGAEIKVPLMSIRAHQKARYAAFHADGSHFNTPQHISNGQPGELYPSAGGFNMVELPYEDGKLSMVLIAPLEKDGLSHIETQLNVENFNQWTSQLQKRDTNVVVPKFRLETEYALGSGGSSPGGLMPQLGMRRAFTAPTGNKGAQFDHMALSDNSSDRLFLETAVHKAFLEVDEKGTEAAAATAIVGVGPTSVSISRPFIPSFVADRPFIAVIRDTVTGTVLFMGRISNPESK